MEEMVEPDRTIMIVSIIGLVVSWGSFFYHKFVQNGAETHAVEPLETEAVAEVPKAVATSGQQRSKKKNKKKR